MHKTEALCTYWISFPRNPELPIGIGVTAFSHEDAFALLAEQGIGAWVEAAEEVGVRKNVALAELSQDVQRNAGPLKLRGVWYPAADTGGGAPVDTTARPNAEPADQFDVWRLDDNGNEFRIQTFADEQAAQAYRDEMEARGHKQTYWVRRNDAKR